MSEKNLTLEEKETINKNTKKASKDLFFRIYALFNYYIFCSNN